MLLLMEILIFISVLAIWWYFNDKRKHENFPPGPQRFPIVGNVVQVLMQPTTFPATAFKLLSNKYGDVMFLKMARNNAVVFASKESIKEILTHDKASARVQPEFIKDRHDGKNLGVIWANGKTWQTLRRFSMRNLRDFGFGKTKVLNELLNNEIEKFSAHLMKQTKTADGGVIYGEEMFALTVVAVLWRLMSGTSYEYENPKMSKLLELNGAFFKSSNLGFDITDAYPILRDWFPNWSGRTLQKRTSQGLYEFTKEMLKEHLKDEHVEGDFGGKGSSFIDVFAKKVDECKEDEDTDFTEEQFVMTAVDLLVAGSETSSNTLSFGVLYMLLWPEVQEKVRAEIKREIPENTRLEAEMKSRLPYTMATILEIYRWSTITPTPVPREATDDFIFRGYFIPKGTSLIFNTYGLHHDKSLWGDPENFRPERFLTPDKSEVDEKVADNLVIFGLGSRFCLGQKLAEPTVFLYFASMIRRFKFEKVPGHQYSKEPVLGVTLSPKPFPVKIIPIAFQD